MATRVKMLPDETFCTIDGTNGWYSVSTLGRVKSNQRRVPTERGSRRLSEVLLKPGRGSHGYLTVCLGRRFGSANIHIKVLEAFAGPRPEGKEACHRDGDKSNNKRTNLYWGAKRENGEDKIRQKRMQLTYVQADEIRARFAAGEKGVDLAREYGVLNTTVSNIVNGRSYVETD